ncbi:tyrosine-type recombinase/integrase [Desulforhabdus amnigena]|uniref:Site-specific integrase n=1 Tax=Desulforhabdus amnigena TaxID=40218 RepID=A0A9W6FWM0_9BACT|nr:site-specific integrase [Desulforhabdus amnigena]GLI36183.1 site-specific integrase [Desulforhabdus amnigena]
MGVKVREKSAGSGVWWLFIDHNGQRKAKKVGTDKKLALEAAKKIEAKLTLGDMGLKDPEKKAPTFKEAADLWLHGYIKPLRRETTFERYSDMLKRHVLPTLGSTPINEIARKDVRELLLSVRAKGLSKASVCLVRDVMSGVFNHAIDDEIIEVNPVLGVVKRLNLSRDKQEEVEPLTKEEVGLFLETCKQNRPEYYPLFLTAFRTGMRLGELLGLKWGDVDWNGKFIRVSRSAKRGKITPTKTGKNRRVDMSDQLMNVLKGLQTQRKREALKKGHGVADGFIFLSREDEILSQNTVRNVFKGILRKAGLRDIRLHETRHTFASLLLTDGQSPVYVKEQLGHSSIQMTVDIYGHLIPSSNRDAVNRLDETQPSATQPQPAKIEKA